MWGVLMPITIRELWFPWNFVYETKDKDGDKIFIIANTELEFFKELKRFGYYEEYIKNNSEKTKLKIEDDNGQMRLF